MAEELVKKKLELLAAQKAKVERVNELLNGASHTIQSLHAVAMNLLMIHSPINRMAHSLMYTQVPGASTRRRARRARTSRPRSRRPSDPGTLPTTSSRTISPPSCAAVRSSACRRRSCSCRSKSTSSQTRSRRYTAQQHHHQAVVTPPLRHRMCTTSSSGSRRTAHPSRRTRAPTHTRTSRPTRRFTAVRRTTQLSGHNRAQ